MSLSIDELAELFERISDGDMDAGRVVADVLEERGYRHLAVSLHAFLNRAEPIEREITARALPPGPKTRKLWEPLRGPWRAIRARFSIVRALEQGRELGMPLGWYSSSRLSYPVRVDTRGAGPGRLSVSRYFSSSSSYVWMGPFFEVCVEDVTRTPQKRLAPGARAFLEQSRPPPRRLPR